MFRRFRSCALGLILAATLVAGASATTVLPINLAETVQYAEKGFVGKVESVEIVKTARGTFAEQITMRVERAVIGTTEGELVTWKQTRNGEEIRFAGMPEFVVGDESLVFLYGKAPGSELQSPVGLGQGVFHIGKDEITGAEIVRNEFGNRTLFERMDLGKLAEDMVESESAEQSATSRGAVTEGGDRVMRERLALAGRTGASQSLDTIVRAAQALDKVEDPVAEYVREDATAGAFLPKLEPVFAPSETGEAAGGANEVQPAEPANP